VVANAAYPAIAIASPHLATSGRQSVVFLDDLGNSRGVCAARRAEGQANAARPVFREHLFWTQGCPASRVANKATVFAYTSDSFHFSSTAKLAEPGAHG
jgi:hypothetical protein